MFYYLLFFGLLNFLNDTFDSAREILFFSLKIGLPLGVFIYVLIIFSSFKEGKIEHKLISKEPLNQLASIGFGLIQVNQQTIWSFSKMEFGKISSYYPIRVSINNKDNIPEVTFLISCKRKKIGLVESSVLEDKLTKHGIKFSRSCFYISFTEKEIKNKSIQDIDQKLNEMIALMKVYKFEPIYYPEAVN